MVNVAGVFTSFSLLTSKPKDGKTGISSRGDLSAHCHIIIATRNTLKKVYAIQIAPPRIGF